jgi:hypothetical protein
VSGTNGLAGAADTIVVIRRDRTSPSGVLLVTGRDVIEASYAVEFEEGRWSLMGGDWKSARERAAAVAATTNRGDLAASSGCTRPVACSTATGASTSSPRTLP